MVNIYKKRHYNNEFPILGLAISCSLKIKIKTYIVHKPKNAFELNC